MAALRSHVPTRMTVDEFIDWNSGDGSDRLWQLVDGELVAMAPGSHDHGALQGEIGRLISNHLRATGSGCRLIVTPGVVPRLYASRNFRIPDLGATCAAPSDEVMVPGPVLLVEVLSPNNEAEPGGMCGPARQSRRWPKSSRCGTRGLKRNCCGVCRTGTGRRIRKFSARGMG